MSYGQHKGVTIASVLQGKLGVAHPKQTKGGGS